MVGPGGLEPPTLRLSGVRSNHLSYEPEFIRLVPLSFKPDTFNAVTPNTLIQPIYI